MKLFVFVFHIHSVLTGDVNAHSSLWHLYTDDHRGQLIAEEHIACNITQRDNIHHIHYTDTLHSG